MSSLNANNPMIFNTAKEVNEYRKKCLCNSQFGTMFSLYRKNKSKQSVELVGSEFILEVALDKWININFNLENYSFKFKNESLSAFRKDLNFKLYAISVLNSIKLGILKYCNSCNSYIRFNSSINLAKNKLEIFSLNDERYFLYPARLNGNLHYQYHIKYDGINMNFYEVSLQNELLGSVSHENFLKMPFDKTYFITKLDKLKIFK